MKTNLNADINVTPLVDVCLVLLIIFMVVIPTMVNSGPIALPDTMANDAIDEQALPITIRQDGSVFIGVNAVRRDEAGALLQRLYATSASRPIAVRADKRVQYGEVEKVLASCREAGWRDITLVGVKTSGPRM
ncbi:MAG TPA: biopolymer transporter ExbD [Thermoanaerobaculia bacterium]|nr:biopolymer transporter ExbD [Thermoanaerobaculia bacterium]